MERAIRIGFVGNCYIFGYRGVAARDTFPEVACRRIEAERPGLRVQAVRCGLFHPADLPRQISRLLSKRPPHVIVVDAAASPLALKGRERVDATALPSGVARLVDTLQEGLAVVNGFSNRHRLIRPAVRAVEGVGRLIVDRKVLPLQRHAAPSVHDYERYLDEAIGLVAATRTTLIVQGPSGFNQHESHHDYKSDSLQLYRDVNAMVRRVTGTHNITMIDRQQVIEGSNSAMFLGKSIRMSPAGHQATGYALASTILAEHIV
jgi:hypothetical protein